MNEQFHSAWIDANGRTGVCGDANALFPWWSFTKTALSATALLLVEKGLINLDELRPDKPFTLRQLLQHCAGVPDYGMLKSYHDAIEQHQPAWPREKLFHEAEADRLVFSPGSGWAYSNIGYVFVGDLIADATGLDLATALRTLLIEPLALASVRVATKPNDFRSIHWAEGRTYDPRWVYHSCLIGTSSDATKFLHALNSGRILHTDSLRAMREAYQLDEIIADRPWTSCAYGLGLMTGLMGEAGRAIGHSGGGPFSVNAVYHFPDQPTPVTVSAFTHGSNVGLTEFETKRIALLVGSKP